MPASVLSWSRIRCHLRGQALHCGSRLDRLQTLDVSPISCLACRSVSLRLSRRELSEFSDGSLELTHDSPIRASLFINLDEFVEIPKLFLATAFESAPDTWTAKVKRASCLVTSLSFFNEARS